MKEKLLATLLMLAIFSGGGTVLRADEISDAIDLGVGWLAEKQKSDGSWSEENGDYPVATTGFAVMKLEEYAFEKGCVSPLDANCPYHENVEDGLAYIFQNAHLLDISIQSGVNNPDSDGDGKGVYFGDSQYTYNTGICMMAIAASRAPLLTATVEGTDYKYLEILQNAVDYFAFGQCDSGSGRGGWYYEPIDNGTGLPDNSNSGYAVQGLVHAAAPCYGFNCTIPAFVKSELSYWIDYIQVIGGGGDGGSGYRYPDSANILRTGNLVLQMTFAGDSVSPPSSRMQRALDYLGRTWNQPNRDPGWKGPPSPPSPHYQATFCVMKGLVYAGVETLNVGGVPVDWYNDFATAILPGQEQTEPNKGSWPIDEHGGPVLATEWALLTLEKAAPPFDCNHNAIPDECDVDCNAMNPCNPAHHCYDDYASLCGQSADCNTNWIPDECEQTCPCLGDLNGDCLIDGRDIQGFVCCILNDPCGVLNPRCPCADLNGSGGVDTSDIPSFVEALLTGPACPEAGACCLSDESCRVMTRFACEATEEGTFLGAGSRCETDTCYEACCLPDYTCQHIGRGACLAQQGAPQGLGTTCQLPAACCKPDGSCVVTTEACCRLAGGDFQVSDATCQPEGACCLPSGTCLVTKELCCTQRNGSYAGDDSSCEETGACCLSDDSCLDTTRAYCCAQPLAQFHGGGTPYGASSTCGAIGACCLPNGSCNDMAQACCNAEGGNYMPGTTCQSITGACCNETTGVCQDLVCAGDCAGPCMRFAANTACVSLNPPCPVVTGACCLPPPFSPPCADTLTCTECAEYWGTWIGGTCETATCYGACCFDALTPGGNHYVACAVVASPALCASQYSGTWQGAHTDCDPSPCVQPTGSCCYGNANCQWCAVLTAVECEALADDIAWTDGGTCDIAACAFLTQCGACCHENHTCDPTTQNDCDTLDWTQFTLCEDAPCYATCGTACPQGAWVEDEGCVLTLNDGCNMDTPAFEELRTLPASITLCGTARTYVDGTNAVRDTDWYMFFVSASKSLTVHGKADFPLQIMLLSYASGQCVDPVTIVSSASNSTTPYCEQDVTFTNPCITAFTTYYLWVGPAVFTGVDCDQYQVVVTTGTPTCK